MKGTIRGSQKVLLAIQHLFAMFGATILVPAITNNIDLGDGTMLVGEGINPSVTLIAAGLGTLVFHLLTKMKVPVFLGSSFAFLPVIVLVVIQHGVQYVQGGLIVAGVLYAIFAAGLYFLGVDKIKKLLPPVVTGPVIIVIGLLLAPVAIDMASSYWIAAVATLLTVVLVSVLMKGFFKLVPILCGIVVGYVLSLILDLTGATAGSVGSLIQTGAFESISFNPSTWFNPFWRFDGSFFTLPRFNFDAILLIAPIAFVTLMEHIGDMTTISNVTKQDFFEEPGVHRTLLGDGVATAVAGLLGGPANTTYSENVGVLAVTKVSDPSVLRMAAVFAIVLGLIAPFGALLGSIPVAVIGGVCILLFGMIAAVGVRTLAEAKLDFTNSRNLIIVSIILVIGLGLSGGITITDNLSLSGLFLAVVVGVILNKVLPENI